MEELSIINEKLPDNPETLAQYDKWLSARQPVYRRLLKDIKDWKTASEEEKRILSRAQDEAEYLIDVRAKIGELMKDIPKQNTHNRAAVRPDNDVPSKTQTITAAGFTPKQAQRYETIANNPDIVEKVKQRARESHDVVTQSAILTAIKEKNRAEKEEKRAQERKENAKKIETLATPLDAHGLFQTIVIDPPWDWGDEGDVNQFGRAKPDYSTMPIEEIEKLPVNKIADDNCHLYLWVTNRSLPKAFRLIDAWGFRYITCITWVKPSIGMGNYFRGDTEQVLFAVKGSQPLKRHDAGTHFNAPRGKGHSAKPNEFYSLVESCSYEPYIDIFGRRDRKGWTIWGENG